MAMAPLSKRMTVTALSSTPSVFLASAPPASQLTVKVELAQSTDSFKKLEQISSDVRSRLRTILGLDAKVMLESPNTLQRFEGKAKRVKDFRFKE